MKAAPSGTWCKPTSPRRRNHRRQRWRNACPKSADREVAALNRGCPAAEALVNLKKRATGVRNVCVCRLHDLCNLAPNCTSAGYGDDARECKNHLPRGTFSHVCNVLRLLLRLRLLLLLWIR